MAFGFVDRILKQRFGALDRKTAFLRKLAKYMRGIAVEEIEIGKIYGDRARSITSDFMSDPCDQKSVVAKHFAANTEDRAAGRFVSDLLDLRGHRW